MPRITEHEHVGCDVIAHQASGDLAGIDQIHVTATAGSADIMFGAGARILPVRIAHEGCCRCTGRIDGCVGSALAHTRQGVAAGGHDHVATDDQIRRAGADPGRIDVFRAIRQAHMRHHRPALLREAAHVQHRASLAFQMCSHRQDLADSHHTGAADTGHQDAVRLIGSRQCRLRQVLRRQLHRALFSRCGFLRFLEFAAFDGDKARAETCDAREILVAR